MARLQDRIDALGGRKGVRFDLHAFYSAIDERRALDPAAAALSLVGGAARLAPGVEDTLFEVPACAAGAGAAGFLSSGGGSSGGGAEQEGPEQAVTWSGFFRNPAALGAQYQWDTPRQAAEAGGPTSGAAVPLPATEVAQLCPAWERDGGPRAAEAEDDGLTDAMRREVALAAPDGALFSDSFDWALQLAEREQAEADWGVRTSAARAAKRTAGLGRSSGAPDGAAALQPWDPSWDPSWDRRLQNILLGLGSAGADSDGDSDDASDGESDGGGGSGAEEEHPSCAEAASGAEHPTGALAADSAAASQQLRGAAADGQKTADGVPVNPDGNPPEPGPDERGQEEQPPQGPEKAPLQAGLPPLARVLEATDYAADVAAAAPVGIMTAVAMPVQSAHKTAHRAGPAGSDDGECCSDSSSGGGGGKTAAAAAMAAAKRYSDAFAPAKADAESLRPAQAAAVASGRTAAAAATAAASRQRGSLPGSTADDVVICGSFSPECLARRSGCGHSGTSGAFSPSAAAVASPSAGRGRTCKPPVRPPHPSAALGAGAGGGHGYVAIQHPFLSGPGRVAGFQVCIACLNFLEDDAARSSDSELCSGSGSHRI